MAEIDLVPAGYRRLLQLRSRLCRFGIVYAVTLVSLILAKAALGYGVRSMSDEIERLEEAQQLDRERRLRIAELDGQRSDARERLSILTGLRGGVAAVDMFRVVDRASDGNVWFRDWKFRRAGEVVEGGPEAVQTGYFLVVPLEKQKKDEREKAWIMRTHMEIEAQSLDHSTLARFVRGLVAQPEIEEVRVLNTRVRQYLSSEVVDFEIAVVVRSSA